MVLSVDRRGWVRIGMLILLLVVGWVIYHSLQSAGWLAHLDDPAGLRDRIASTGLLAPLTTIGLMALAILIKLIPSAMVALASGALFGHTWGTIYIIIGAEIGALIAFGVVRLFGPGALCRISGRRLSFDWPGSQHQLMLLLFLSRLAPVIPFDLVSYAMGLTPLTLGRFALATLLGLIPSSFLLAHFGGEMMEVGLDASLRGMAIAALVLLLPVAAGTWLVHRAGWMAQFRRALRVGRCD